MGLGNNVLTVTPAIDDRTPALFADAGRVRDPRIFRAARRHSRRVRFLRIAIPLSVVLAVAAVIAVASWVKPLQMLAKVPVKIDNLVVSGTKVTMQAPRITGFTNDKRQYEMTAQVAARDLRKADLVELQGVRAVMELEDKSIFETTANNGLYNTKTELLKLEQNVLAKTSNGYRARLAEAVLDIRGNKITSDKPVEVTGGDWLINANSMEVTNSGEVIRFDRGVSVVMQSNIDLSGSADASPPSSRRKR
jgi:lipopolysaccharide export system protein LptC